MPIHSSGLPLNCFQQVVPSFFSLRSDEGEKHSVRLRKSVPANLMVIAFFLFETFEQDMDTPVIPVTWYPTTFRRRRLDIAGKIVRTASRTVLKITATAESTVQFQQLWKRSVEIPPIQSCPRCPRDRR